jgi:hypothetical protein
MVSQRICSFPVSHASSQAKSLLWSAMRVGQRPTQLYSELAVAAIAETVASFIPHMSHSAICFALASLPEVGEFPTIC